MLIDTAAMLTIKYQYFPKSLSLKDTDILHKTSCCDRTHQPVAAEALKGMQAGHLKVGSILKKPFLDLE